MTLHFFLTLKFFAALQYLFNTEFIPQSRWGR